MLVWALGLLCFAGGKEPNRPPEHHARSHLEESTDSNDSDAPEDAADEGSSEETTEEDLKLLRDSVSVPLQPLSWRQHKWLKPNRSKFGPNPYTSTDFTAYTLEFKEVEVGLANMTVGIHSRMQIGTAPPLWLVGVANGHAKINTVRYKGFDLALRGSINSLKLGDFSASYYDAGVLVSQVVDRRFSLHGGASYTSIQLRGVPDLGQVFSLASLIVGDLDAYEPPEEWSTDEPPRVVSQAIAARVAAELRLNRRDSFVLQGQTILRAKVVTDIGDLQLSEALPPVAGLDELLSYDGTVKVTDAYITSVSYQASFRRVNLRIGVGLSSVDGAWIFQANELSYRFGGDSRKKEGKQRRTWKDNVRDVGPPVDAVPAPPPPPSPEPEPSPESPEEEPEPKPSPIGPAAPPP